MYDIAVIPGDGIGPEVLREAERILDTVSRRFGFSVNTLDYPFGADHYLETNELLPDDKLSEMKDMDAILLGAIGDPRVEAGVLERGIVGTLRFDLDLYVNLRPIRLYASHLSPLKDCEPGDLDILVVRENTEDVYAGIGGSLKKGTNNEVATQEMIYTHDGTERILRYAYERASERNGMLTLVDKYNAIEAHGLYRRLFDEIAEEFPNVEQDRAYVDAMTMWMVKNPSYFDTVVTTNMFGDIITDLGAMLQGGLGIAAGGNIHPGQIAMFEPIHGSAPKHAGKNNASPIASILAVSMMCSYLGEEEAAGAIENAVRSLFKSGHIKDVSTSGELGTDEMGSLILDQLTSDE